MNSLSQFRFCKEPHLEWRFLAFPGSNRLQIGSPQAHRYFPLQGRYGIYLALHELGALPGDEVLLPSFICAAAVEPIIAHGCKPIFYEVTTECCSHIPDIERKIGVRTRALLVIHYFGFPNPGISMLLDLCRSRGIALIEDCAHVLSGSFQGVKLGSFGDVAIFSFRSFCPLPTAH